MATEQVNDTFVYQAQCFFLMHLQMTHNFLIKKQVSFFGQIREYSFI